MTLLFIVFFFMVAIGLIVLGIKSEGKLATASSMAGALSLLVALLQLWFQVNPPPLAATDPQQLRATENALRLTEIAVQSTLVAVLEIAQGGSLAASTAAALDEEIAILRSTEAAIEATRQALDTRIAGQPIDTAQETPTSQQRFFPSEERPDFTLLRSWQAHTDAVTKVAFHPTDLILASGGYDQAINIWSVPDTQKQHSNAEHSAIILSLTWAPDGHTIAVGANNGQLSIWPWQTEEPATLLETSALLNFALSFSPDGGLLANGDDAGHITMRETNSYSVITTLTPTNNDVYDLAYSPDGVFLGFVTVGDSISILRPPEFAHACTLAPFSGQSFAYAPDSAQVVVGGIEGSLALIDVQACAVNRVWTAHGRNVTDIAFDPNGALFASSSNDGTVKVWEGDELRWTFDNDQISVETIAFSADGRYLAAGDSRGQIILWEKTP